MRSIVINKNFFSGQSHLFDAGPHGLSSVIRNLAIDNARSLINAASISTVTDSTGGTAKTTLTAAGIVAPSGIFNASSGGGVQAAALNTSLGKIRNAQASWASTINKVGVKLGLPGLSYVEGTSTYNAIPAQDTSATTASGSSAVSYGSFTTMASSVLANQHAIFVAINRVLAALGLDKIPYTFLNSFPSAATINLQGDNHALLALPAVVADTVAPYQVYPYGVTPPSYTPGTNSVSLADGTLFLSSLANNFATFASFWNTMLSLSGPSGLTDSTGGTAASTLVSVGSSSLQPFTDNQTQTSAAAASLNSLFTTLQNAFSSLQARINSYANYEAIPPVPDASGGTASGTLSSISVTPAAGGGATFAGATFTETSTHNFLAGDVVTIGNQTFTFVSSIGSTPGNILVRANTNAGFAASIGDIVAAMAASIANTGATANYIPNLTPSNVGVGAAGNGLTTGQTFNFVSLVDGTPGDALASTYTAAGTSAGSFGGATFTGGNVATAASLASVQASFIVIEDNISTIAAQLNYILNTMAYPLLPDNSGGVAQPGLEVIPATAVTDNEAQATGVLNSAVETCLSNVRNNISTLNTTLTTIIGETTFVAPISVIAG